MPRALWTGSLSFGLVNVPVQLVSAVRDLDLHFRQLHAKDHVPVETRRVCSKEGVEVPWEEIGNEYEDVVLSDEELSAADPHKTRTIDIEAFVKLAEIDPIYYDHPYYLVPAGETDGTVRAYRLLTEVMAKAERVALGRFVMRTKEYLVAIRVRDKALTLNTLRFHDEIRDTKGIDGAGGRTKPKEVSRAVALIEALSTDWDPGRYEDCYRKRLQSIVRRKRQGGEIKVPETDPERTAPVPDLMAALEETLARIKDGGGNGRGRSSGGLEDLSRDELYERATKADVPGRSKMTKDELVAALSR
jgi:DNA end-binding protein Ku